MRRAAAAGAGAGAVRVDEASSASTFRELDDAFLQKQTKVWLGEVLHLRFDEDILVADLLADGELLFQVSKVIWKRLLKKNREQLKQSKVYIYERTSFGRSNGKYMPYSKVDSFLKICQIVGLAGIDLFTPSDVVEKRNVRKVCICIRSLSKKSRMMRLNVPDFDIVTYTIAMPNYIVGGIRRNLEQPQYSSSGSNGYSPCANSKELQQQITFSGQDDQHVDAHYDSDEAESRPSVPEPEDLVREDSFAAMLLQLNDAPKEEGEGYGESGHDIHEEKSLSESVGSLDFGMDSDSVDSTSLIDSKNSYSAQSATDQCSRTRTAKYSLSSEESDYISSHLALDGGKDDTESLAPFIVSERIYDEHVNLDHTIKGDSERFADNAKQGSASEKDNDATGRHCDDFVCDRESVCSSCEEPRYALNGKGSDMSSEECSGSTQRHETGQKLQIVPEDTMNMIEPSTNEDVTGITGLNHDHDEQLHSHDQNSRGTHRKVQMVPEDMMNMVEPITNKDVTGITELNHDHDEQLHSHDQSSGSTHRPNAEQGPVISEIEDGSTSREPNPEFSTMNQVVPPEVHQDTLQTEDKPVKSEDISKNFIAQKREDDAPKSGKGVLKSVAGGITLVGAVFFIVILRRSKERSFTAVTPSLSDKNQRDSRAKNNDERKAAAVYPGEWLKV